MFASSERILDAGKLSRNAYLYDCSEQGVASFRSSYLNFCYHCFNQKFQMQNNENVPGIIHCIAYSMNRCSQKLGMVWFYLKNKAAFLKNQSLHFIHQSVSRSAVFLLIINVRERQLLRLVPGNAHLIDTKCQYLHIYLTFLDRETWVFQNNPLKFSLQGHIQQLCNSFNNNVLRNVSRNGNFRDQKCEKVQNFSFHPDDQSFCSPNLLVAFRLLGCQPKLSHS